MDLFTALRNIYLKIQKNINVERITNSEIDDAFGGAAGTGTDAQDYVIEYQNSENEGYTKWASGKLECWKRAAMTVTAGSGPWGGIYYGTTSGVNYPHAFSSLPTVTVTVQSHSGNVWMAQENQGQSLTNTNGFYVYSPVAQTNLNCTFNIYAVGKWK